MAKNTKPSIPNEKLLIDALNKISYTLDKAYLQTLKRDYAVFPFEMYNKYTNKDKKELCKVTYSSNIRVIKIDRWVYDRDESIIDRFKNIINVFSGNNSSIAMIIRRTPNDNAMYFMLKNETTELTRHEESDNNIKLLDRAIRGNFNGTEVKQITYRDHNTEKELEKKFVTDMFGTKISSIAQLTSLPSEKSENFISQGIEKLLDGFVPEDDSESYTVVILAEPISQNNVRSILGGYEELATDIIPFTGYQFSAGISDTKTKGEFKSASHTEGVNSAITKTHSVNVSVTASYAPGGVGGSATVGYGYSRAKTEGRSESDTNTSGTNYNLSLGTSENTQYTYKSFGVTALLEKLDINIKRMQNAQGTGLWQCASYVLSENSQTSISAVNFLRSLIQGDQTYIEPTVITEWKKGDNEEAYAKDFLEIEQYLYHFTHPIYVNRIETDFSVNATSNLSTTELANIFAFPKYSVTGLPIIDCARFGRNVHSLEDINGNARLGCIYHMLQPDNKRDVTLNRDSLTMHTFVTGSTGSGKSNTVFKLLSALCLDEPQNKATPVNNTQKADTDDNTHFLVIEPAKGEYKDVFGGRKDVNVWGTNHNYTPLLRINPFQFPKHIHVLEHIDRLVEIFNACWPMYAAMPAILKDAIESSYERAGWSLKKSICATGTYPTFKTLLDELSRIIDESEYSKDTASDYKGALITRVKSLTRGIHGQIFCSGDLELEKLFDENAIVDISRVGSSETKSLIMGILILKLQEYRMKDLPATDPVLKHITVLEEAHHLLRRTSSEQSQDSSNLQGKSVEMLTNAIAEMRAYNEGFIIADQSPGLMDMSVIRNTNTKIIMRLPDEGDRQLVGRAAGLNDSQIVELARLKRGVAAVSQNNWLEPVLCQVDKYEQRSTYPPMPEEDYSEPVKRFLAVLADTYIGKSEKNKLKKEDVDALHNWLNRQSFDVSSKESIQHMLNNTTLKKCDIGGLLYNILDIKRLSSVLINPNKNEILPLIESRIAQDYELGQENLLVRQLGIIALQLIYENLREGDLRQEVDKIINNGGGLL